MKWLHLSDLHYNPELDGRNSDQLRNKLPLYLKEQEINADEIFITGDFRHAKHQTDNLHNVAKEAVEYIREIAKSVGVSCAEKIHILPGNHDLTRSDAVELDRIINEYNFDKGIFSREDLSDLQGRFEFFQYVCQELYGNEEVYNSFCTQVHPYYKVDNYVVLCLNTAIACGQDNERGNLIIGNYYLYKSLEKIKQDYPGKEIIVLAHHALEFLSKSEREQIERLFANYAVIIYLCGDAHEIWGRKINNWFEITTGCLVSEKGVETVFCTGNTNENKILAYQWDSKFGKWSDYHGFNSHIQQIARSLKQGVAAPALAGSAIYNLPKLPRNYRMDNQIKADALKILKAHRFLYISGMSGIGKTSFSIALSEMLKNETKLNGIYFVDASHITSVQGLNSVDLDMSGRKVNLLGTIKMGQSLYIIDDLQHNIDDIVELFLSELPESANSFIIITSQLESRLANRQKLQYSLPFLTDEKDILNILNLYLPKEKHCPEALIKTLKLKTNGHPLLLNSLRSLIQYDNASWQELLEEDLKDFVYHEVEDGKTLMSKILNRHQGTLERELAAVCWLRSKYVSVPLLSKIITKDGIRKLSCRSFIQISADNGTIKIHDIIFDCIIELQHTKDAWKGYEIKFNSDFYAYFIKEKSRKSSDYYKALHMHEDKIICLAQKEDKPGIEWYFYSQAFPNDDFNVFQSFSYTDEECGLWLSEIQGEYIIGTLLEFMERKSRNDRDLTSYKESMDSQIKTLRFLLGQPGLNTDLRFDVLHHLGKLYRNINELDKAINCFEEVLDNKPNSHESKLQLVRIHKRQKSLSAEQISAKYIELLDDYIKGTQISMSVVLAVYNDLYTTNKEETFKKKYFLDKFDYFKKAILSMAVEAFDQPYSVLAITMKYYTYNYPDKLFSLIDKLPIPSVNMINKGNYFDIAQMYKEIGKAIMWSEDTMQSMLASDYFALAEEFYSLLDNTRLNKEYPCVQRAENLILLERYSDTLVFLRNHEFKESPFWNHRYGQALVGIGESEIEQALQYFQIAIDSCTQDTYLTSFNHAMANALAKMRQPHAKDYYQEALRLCDSNDKYKKKIKSDMEIYSIGV